MITNVHRTPFWHSKRYDSIVFFFISLVYTLAWNWSSLGPVYLSDTIGYMVNAAIIAGHRVDAMGSWHAGYSIIIAPLFLLENPFQVWKGVQITNAILVAISVYLCGVLIDRLTPNLDRTSRTAILAVTILYPAFTAIAGYAYTSPAMSATVLMIALIITNNSEPTISKGLFLAIIGGFSYWIHPTGLVVLLAVFILIFSRLMNFRWRDLLVYIFISAAMVWIYNALIHQTLYELVTPEEFDRFSHYSIKINHLLSIDGMTRFLVMSAGQLSYQIVSTLGLTWLGLWYGLRLLKIFSSDIFIKKRKINFLIPIFSLLLILGTISISSLGFSASESPRNDYWIYGRYIDALIHPLLIFGLITLVTHKEESVITPSVWISSILTVISVGYGLKILADPASPHSYQSTLAFWPQFILKDKNYMAWMLLGAAGILLMALLSYLKKNILLLLLVFSFSLIAYVAGKHNLNDRQNLENHYSRPSAIMDIVRSTWEPGTCIGFAYPLPSELSLMQRERYRMYAFYFFNYRYRRYFLSDWKRECQGPLLTYDPIPIIEDPKLKVILREESTGIFLVTHSDEILEFIQNDLFDRDDVKLMTNYGTECLIAGCFSISAEKLNETSQIGFFRNNRLETDGRAGFLFYGPYRRIKSGSYEIQMEIDVRNAKEAVIDVVSNRGRTSHARIKVSDVMYNTGVILVSFTLSKGVNDLEIRLHVGESDDISIHGYEVKKPNYNH